MVNKVETNLYFIKTDSINFDYNKHIEHVNLILEEIAFEFDYVLIDSCVFNDLAFSGLLEISNEIIMVLTDDNIVIKNSAKLISKIKSKSKNVQVKILLNKARIIHQIKGEVLDEITISKLLKEEIIFVLPKFLKYNQIKIQKMVNFKNKILSRYCYSIITNKQDILNYQKKYLGPIGWLRRKLYEKFEQ